MKKLLIILLFIPFELQAQNTVSLTYQPIDFGIGVKYDHYFRTGGIYVAGAWGNYRCGEKYIKDHVRMSGGVSALIPDARLSIGMVYHRFGEVMGDFPEGTLNPVSFELGASAFRKRFSMGFRYDIVKHEACIDIGVNF